MTPGGGCRWTHDSRQGVQVRLPRNLRQEARVVTPPRFASPGPARARPRRPQPGPSRRQRSTPPLRTNGPSAPSSSPSTRSPALETIPTSQTQLTSTESPQSARLTWLDCVLQCIDPVRLIAGHGLNERAWGKSRKLSGLGAGCWTHLRGRESLLLPNGRMGHGVLVGALQRGEARSIIARETGRHEEGAAIVGIDSGAAGVAGGSVDIDLDGCGFGDQRQLVERCELAGERGPGRGE